jgi:hypothetical protein
LFIPAVNGNEVIDFEYIHVKRLVRCREDGEDGEDGEHSSI